MSVELVGLSYSEFYLETTDCAVCSLCDADIRFDPGNIDALILELDSHECAEEPA